MAAYATPRLELASPPFQRHSESSAASSRSLMAESSLLDALIDQIAERVAERLSTASSHDRQLRAEDEWFDSRHASDYLGIHRDTLRKLAAERAIPAEQDGPNCKLYFRRSDLDVWRRSGGRPRHLASMMGDAA